MSAILLRELWQILEDYSLQHGEGSVRETCRRFMLKKTLAGVDATKRKPIPRRWVEKAYIQQRGMCARCGKDMALSLATGDHTKSLAQGGAHNARNISALHGSCNSSKGARSLSEDAKFTGQTVRGTLERINGDE
jgi:5-methylcytosine-specific restriction endonuclease McrA